jgi:hypothetical protein
VADQTVTAALIGNRRAHQYLRLVDLGRRSQAVELLESLTQPADLVFMGKCLQSVARTCGSRLPATQQQAIVERQAELDAMFQTHKGSPGQLQRWATATADEALRVVRERLPNRKLRIAYFESSARASFDGEESGSHIHRTLFKEPTE